LSVQPWIRCGAVLLTLAGSAAGQVRGHKLNSPLAAELSGDVTAARVSSDGFVVFSVRRGSEELQELYSVPAAGGAPLLLSDRCGKVFDLTPDGQRVVFATDVNVQVTWVDGASAPIVVGGLEGGGPIEELVVSADGAHAVYRQVEYREFDPDRYWQRLYSVSLDLVQGWRRIDGGGSDSDVESFVISPDGTWVAYREGELQIVPTDGSQAPRELVSFATDAWFSADSQHVLFSAFFRDDSLWSVPVAGGGAVELLSASFQQGFPERSTAPVVHGDHVYFLATVAVQRLWRAPADGSAPAVRIDAPPALFGGAGVRAFQLLPGGGHVVYSTLLAPGEGTRLFRVPTDGSQAAVPLDGPLVLGGGLEYSFYWPSFAVSPDGTRVAFVADREVRGRYELWSSPTDGSSVPVRIGPLWAAERSFQPRLAFTPDGEGVFFRLRESLSQRIELYAAPSAAASSFVRVSDDLIPGGGVTSVLPGPGGQRVFYVADQESSDRFELYTVRLDSPGNSVRLSPALQPSALGEVHDVFIGPQGTHAVYLAELGDDDAPGLHARELDGVGRERDLTQSALAIAQVLAVSDEHLVFTTRSDPPLTTLGTFGVRLDGTTPPVLLTTEERVEYLAVSDDGRAVAFLRDEGSHKTLRVSHTDGSVLGLELARVDRLSGGLVAAPGSERVVFTTYVHPEVGVLFSAPLDGSAPPVRISTQDPSLRRTSRTPVFSPDRRSVLYLASADSVPGFGFLFVTTLDGSVPGRMLSSEQAWEVIHVTPDSMRVVYAGVVGSNGQGLFVAPLDGSTPRIQLTNPAVAGTIDLEQVVVTSTHAFYVANGAGTIGELFRVPLDGSAPPERVTGAARVLDLRVSADEALSFRSGGVPWLYSLPTAGSTSRLLSTGLAPDEEVASYVVHGSGAVVYWTRKRISFERQRLFAVPIEGGTPRRLTPPWPDDRSVGKYVLTPRGERVLYLSDEESRGHPELYESFLALPHRPR